MLSPCAPVNGTVGTVQFDEALTIAPPGQADKVGDQKDGGLMPVRNFFENLFY